MDPVQPATYPRFLVVDQNSDCRYLLVKTLRRKFPAALMVERADGEATLLAARSEPFHAIVVHRTLEYEGIELIAMLREVNAGVPIIMVSGRDCAAEALAAGATLFMNYDEWTRIGTVIETVIAACCPQPFQPA